MHICTQAPFEDTVRYFLKGLCYFLDGSAGKFIVLSSNKDDLPQSCKGRLKAADILRLIDDPDFIKFLEKNEEISIKTDKYYHLEISKNQVSQGDTFLFYFNIGFMEEEKIKFNLKIKQGEIPANAVYNFLDHTDFCAGKCIKIFALSGQEWTFTN